MGPTGGFGPADLPRIDRLNVTLWNPGPNPIAAYRGLSLGLIGTKAQDINVYL